MDWFGKSLFPLGLGTSKLCSLNGGLSLAAAERLLSAAHEQGIRFMDTAPSYGQGQAEIAMGRLPRRVKDELVICSKVGYSFGRTTPLINALKPILQPAAKSAAIVRTLLQKSRDRAQQSGTLCLDIQPATIRDSLTGTLRRLGRDHLDILLLHDPSPESLGDDNIAQLDSLKSEGLLGAWGVSTTDMTVARRALEIEQLAILEVAVNETRAAAAGDLLSQCHQRGIAVIANSVLTPRASNAPARAVDAASRVTRCLEFALEHTAVRVVLCGTTNANHLAANVAAMQKLMQVA